MFPFHDRVEYVHISFVQCQYEYGRCRVPIKALNILFVYGYVQNSNFNLDDDYPACIWSFQNSFFLDIDLILNTDSKIIGIYRYENQFDFFQKPLTSFNCSAFSKALPGLGVSPINRFSSLCNCDGLILLF